MSAAPRFPDCQRLSYILSASRRLFSPRGWYLLVHRRLFSSVRLCSSASAYASSMTILTQRRLFLANRWLTFLPDRRRLIPRHLGDFVQLFFLTRRQTLAFATKAPRASSHKNFVWEDIEIKLYQTEWSDGRLLSGIYTKLCLKVASRLSNILKWTFPSSQANHTYFMSGWFLNSCGIMEPWNHWCWISLNSTFEKQSFSVIFLSYSWFFLKSWSKTIDLPKKISLI